LTEAAPEPRQPLWFLLLLALASAGGAVAYVPFLTVLLPVQVIDLAGTVDVKALSYATFGGAIVASLANIGFGWLSDRSGHRRGWILAGLLLSGILLNVSGQAESIWQLVACVMLWQLALNMMLAPIAAWAGDCVPDAQKGLLGGLFAFGPALGALSGAIVTIPGLADGEQRRIVVSLIVTAMVLPALLLGKGRRLPHLMVPAKPAAADAPGLRRKRSQISGMWLARLLVQVSEAALFAFLLFWLRSLSPDLSENSAAQLFGIVLAIAVPIALFAGRWSDRNARPMRPLAILAGLASMGLLVMALASGLSGALAGYLLFGVSSITFLSLHSSQTLRVLRRPQLRGRDLGVFNLTNTVPSLIIPGLTIALVPAFGFSALFLFLALLAASACLLIVTISRLN
tara:strand:- start:10637 stop:11836 length:1200 start_codon:yes stop_codon:yes gene_type:complete